MSRSLDLDRTLSGWIVRVARAHRAEAQRLLGAVGLHAGQELLLAALWREDGQSQAALARALGVSPPTITKIARHMAEARLIEARTCPGDSRLSRLHLTAKGRSARAGVEQAWRTLDAVTRTQLTPAEARTLVRLLGRVLAALEAGRAGQVCGEPAGTPGPDKQARGRRKRGQ